MTKILMTGAKACLCWEVIGRRQDLVLLAIVWRSCQCWRLQSSQRRDRMLLRRCLVAAMSAENLVPSSRSATSYLRPAAKVGALELYSVVVVLEGSRIFPSLCWVAPSKLALVEA